MTASQWKPFLAEFISKHHFATDKALNYETIEYICLLQSYTTTFIIWI